jgi:hypothetical protein
MPPPLSAFQHVRLSGWIVSITDQNKKNIAEHIHKEYWHLLTIDSLDGCFIPILLPAIIVSPIPFIVGFLFPSIYEKGYSIFSWMLSYVVLQMFAHKCKWFEAKRSIDNIPDKKKEFEMYISDPVVKEVYEEMRNVFNNV